MAGRGRGRGSTISFNVEALGISKGETLPVALQQPPPNFPSLQYKAVPLLQNEEESYLLALKQEFRTAVRELPYYYTPEVKKKDIVRYSDKYQNGNHDSGADWEPDWSYMPEELKPRKPKNTKVAPKIVKKKNLGEDINVTQTLKTLEEKEKAQEAGGGQEEASGEEEEEAEGGVEDTQVYDEEDMEEETDYILSYFDNGEGLDDEDENLDDGPTYS